jgi:polysaccharide export outer membrane protein
MQCASTCPPPVPHELSKVTPAPYVIEPPDILLVDAVRLVPKPPYHIEPLDVLGVEVVEALPNAPIKSLYSVEPTGVLNFGFSYPTVPVAGLTIEEAKKTIEKALLLKLKPPFEVRVQLAEFKALQQVRGEHLVQRDDTINLGTYGRVVVGGLTIPEAKEAIEAHLSNYLLKPQVSVDVGGFNHDVIYVMMDSIQGELVIRVPSQGKETVLDVMGLVGGLTLASDRHRVWVARPVPSGLNCNQILQVDWIGITQRGETATNYQLFPGDRIYCKADPLLRLDALLAKIIAPVERVFGITLLGNELYRELRMPINSTGTGTGTGTGTRTGF